MDHIKNSVIRWLTATIRRKEIEIEDLIRAKADPKLIEDARYAKREFEKQLNTLLNTDDPFTTL